MEFTVCGEVIDEYGDVCCEDVQFTLDRKEHTVTLHRENETMQIMLTEKMKAIGRLKIQMKFKIRNRRKIQQIKMKRMKKKATTSLKG